MSESQIETMPVFPSLNIEETIQFYQDKLGLEVTYKDENYLIMRRPGMEIHFWLTDQRDLCENSSIYIRGDAIEDLHAEYSQAGIPKMTKLMDREWGMREFYIHDPHGNLLRFGREIRS